MPQFITEIDGLDIHFIHVRSRHKDGLPLIVTHGWPGSIIEQLKIIEPLTDPTADGASAADAFHLVIPSMPGYGFSGKPAATGWGPRRVARTSTQLMTRLGYTRFVAQGGDWARPSPTRWRCRRRRSCSASTSTFPGRRPARRRQGAQRRRARATSPGDGAEPQRLRATEWSFFAKSEAYAQFMGTRPQTLYGIANSPVGLAAWMMDHGDGYGQPAAPDQPPPSSVRR